MAVRPRRPRSARALLVALCLAAGGAASVPGGARHVHSGPDLFVRVSDGTEIAISVVSPRDYDPANPGARRYPAILEMAGYENGSSSDEGRTFFGETEDHCRRAGLPCPGLPLTDDSHAGTGAFRFDGEYVTVHASVRGTGCSSGEFDLFSTRSALDGVEIIERWIVRQPWSNGTVGILGHSYGSITGFMVAAMYGFYGVPTKHLVAVTVSGLIDDLYRGITYPGGSSNYLFPPVWTLAYRPAYDVLGGQLQPIVRHGTDEIARRCLRNIATHRRAVAQDPVVNGIFDTDGEWWRARSLVTYAKFIDVPIHITGAHQDEQTGPRFPHLFELIRDGVPKRLLMMNGDHGSQVDPEEVWRDRKAWMDYWMRGVPNPYVDPATRPTSVRALLEMHATPNGTASNGIKDAADFPLEDTVWTPFFLGPDGTLSRSRVARPGTVSYLSGTKRQSWFYEAGPGVGPPLTTARGPDELDFVSAPFRTDTLVVGPITANLFLSSTATDTEIFVQVTDRDPAGNVSYLQRGILRASHRAIDPAFSDYDDQPDPLDPSRPFLYRPWRPHTNTTTIRPLRVEEYLIEIWPVSHVFRAGHRLQVKIMGPPALDSLYAYVPRTPPALNTVHVGGPTPSRITVPVVSLAGVTLGPPLACGQLDQVRCFPD
jgi:putative CocE/NonD family hydrolase